MGATFFVNSNSDFAIDNGGSIALSGRNTTSSTNSVVWGVVKGAKENATSTNTAGYLAFASQNHNAGALVEAMRIDSSGNIKLTSNAYQALAHKNYGYSGSYGAVVIGATGSNYTTVSLGVDVSTIAGGNFTVKVKLFSPPMAHLCQIMREQTL